MVATTGVAAAVVVGGPVTAASAGPLVCEPGKRSANWSQKDAKWIMTHGDQIGIPRGGSGSRTTTVSHHTTITSKRTVEGKVKYRAGFILTSMNGEFKGKVAEAGKKTKRGRVELRLNFDTPGTYAAYKGVKRVKARYHAKTCNSNGSGFNRHGYGKARSWTVPAEGAVKCNQKTKKGSAMRAAKKKFC